MPVLTRSTLALVVVAAMLGGALVAQTMVQQQTDAQVMLAAQQLVRESQQTVTRQTDGPPDSGPVTTTVYAPGLEKKEVAPPPPPPPPTPLPKGFSEEFSSTYNGKALPPGVLCNERGICRNVGVGPSLATESSVDAAASTPETPPAPPPPPPPPRPSTFDLPPPPPPTPGALRGPGNHPEAALCDLKNKNGPENGVIFVNDPKAKALFKDDASYNTATSEKTGMPSVPGAGNTWVRLLIEKGSALRTGSVFGDGFIKRMGMAGEGKRDTSVIMIKMHYPILGQDMTDAGRIFWLVRHPLSNIISQAKWHITGSHTKVVTQDEFNNYLKLGTFRYHLKMWVMHTKEWIGRTKEKDTLVVRMEDFKADCTNALGRAMDWLGVSRREDRIDCACGRDHRAKRASNFSHAFTPEMLQEARKQAGPLMAQLGYDLEQTQLKAVPEFGLPALPFPSQRRQQRETHGLLQGQNDDDLDALRGDTANEHEVLFRDYSGFAGFAGRPGELEWWAGD